MVAIASWTLCSLAEAGGAGDWGGGAVVSAGGAVFGAADGVLAEGCAKAPEYQRLITRAGTRKNFIFT